MQATKEKYTGNYAQQTRRGFPIPGPFSNTEISGLESANPGINPGIGSELARKPLIYLLTSFFKQIALFPDFEFFDLEMA